MTASEAPLGRLSRVCNGWLVRRGNRGNARARLFCFPHSGAGAALYRDWFDAFPPELDVCAIEPPGRIARLTEPAPATMAAFVEALNVALDDWLDLPFAVFGYSLGAAMAFEWCRLLRRKSSGIRPSYLVVAAASAPQLTSQRRPISHLPKAEFLEQVESHFGPIDRALAAEPDVLDVILGILRNDLRMGEAYRCEPEEPLPVPILALGGSEDRGVPVERLSAWKAQTRARFDLQLFSGSHFFLRDRGAQVRDSIAKTILPALDLKHDAEREARFEVDGV